MNFGIKLQFFPIKSILASKTKPGTAGYGKTEQEEHYLPNLSAVQ
jgi:hypothetical protein